MEKWRTEKQTFKNMFKLQSLTNSHFSRNAPHFPGIWCSKPSLCFGTATAWPVSQPGFVSLGALVPSGLGSGPSSSLFTCNLNCSHLRPRGPPPSSQGNGCFFFLSFFLSFLRYVGLSLLWPLPLRSTGSGRAGSAAMAHRPSRSATCGNLPGPGHEPASPASAGGLSTTAPPGKPLNTLILKGEGAEVFF